MANIVVMDASRGPLPPITSLGVSLSKEPFVDGMKLGTSIDAITGDRSAMAIDPSTIAPEPTISASAGETYYVEMIEDVRKLDESKTFKVSASVTAPVDGLKVGGDRSMDFNLSDTEEGGTLLYIIDWERKGDPITMKHGAKLTEEASNLAKVNSTKFRKIYGDYYVSQYDTGARFTAIMLVIL